MKRTKRTFIPIIFILALLLGTFFANWPSKVTKVEAASTFQIKTGYYIGTGASRSITGIGFQPSLVIIKSDTTAGVAVFKSSSMPSPNLSYFSATADNTTSQITLDANGFTLGTLAAVNSPNVRYTYTAFGSPECSSSSDFCVGYYIGDGLSSKKITTGFQPDFVMAKRSGTRANWRSSSMPDNRGQYFDNFIEDATGTLFTTIDSDGFNVGTTNNTNLGIFYYVAFKNVPGKMNVGSFTGDGTDDRNIVGIGFQPDFVIAKNADLAITGVFNTTETYGDYSSLFTATANTANNIQALQNDGFQVGSGNNVNGNLNTIYWATFSGVQGPTSSGSFSMANGSYTGTGVETSQSITDLGFTPDLVIIKHNDQVTDQHAVFRTSMMSGDSTAYFSNTPTNFTNGITSLDSDGFTVGISATVNTSGDTYYWTAFGNAWKPDKNSGSANFVLGAYMGNGIDNRDIPSPYQLDMVSIKRLGTATGAWRTSQMVGDFSAFFSATAGAANNIQQISSGGFQAGTSASVNASASLYWWFGFKSGANFTVNNYYGTGFSQAISSVGFQPDLLWIKSSTSANSAVLRTSTQTGDAAQPFVNMATITGAINELNPDGFVVGTTAETNSNSIIYRYAAWKIPDVIPPVITEVTPISTPTNDNTPDYVFNTDEAGTISYSGSCSSTTTSAIIGDNTIILNSSSDGTYSDCSITVTDSANNISNILNIPPFTIDTTPPSTPISSPSAGAYTSTQSVTISSDGSAGIRYTDDESEPSCSIGALYLAPIDIAPPKTIKAVGCDSVGNQSPIATFIFTLGSPFGGGSSGGSYNYTPPSNEEPSNNSSNSNEQTSEQSNEQNQLQFKTQEQVELSEEEKIRRTELMKGTYAWWYIDQSPYPSELNPGEEVEVWIEIKNIGTATWFNNGDRVIRLGSGSKYGNENQQRDYDSEFSNPDWYSANRPTNILHQEVQPGWHTRFQFKIKAPSVAGNYKAYFTPVIDGLAWMEDIGIYWEIQVTG